VVIELVLGALAAGAVGRGAWLARRSAPKASSWLAAGSALFLFVSGRFPDSYEVTAVLLTLGITGVSAAGAMLVREQALKRDRRLWLDVADDEVVRGLLRDVEDDARRRSLSGDTPPDDVGRAPSDTPPTRNP